MGVDLKYLPLWLPFLLAAPAIGSFLGLVVSRGANAGAIVLGRSKCDSCGHTLGWRDLLPLISWLLLKRRCRYCLNELRFFYPLVEIAACVPVLWAWSATTGWSFVASVVLGWMLIALGLIDWCHQRLPNALTTGVLITGIVAAYTLDRTQFADRLIGAIVGFVIFAVITTLYRMIRKRDGLGWGDAKLLAGLGAWVSWQGLPILMFSASAMGLVYAVVRTCGQRTVTIHDRLPFGPFLALSGWIVWLYGPLLLTQ